MPFALIWHNLRRHWVRTALTVGSLTIALFLITVLRALVISLESGVRGAASNRLVTQSAVSLFVNLPISYQPKIDQVEGVDFTCKWQWFGAYYKDADNFLAEFGVDKHTFFEMYPEIELLPGGSKQEFLERRNACIVGVELAEDEETYGWKVGDTIPLKGNLFPRNDGGAWEFYCAGIYKARMPVDNRTIFFGYDFLQQAGEAGETLFWPSAGTFAIRTKPGADQDAIMRGVDQMFENGPQRTQTQPESEFNRQFVSMVGNIPALMAMIGGAVTFAIVIAALNTMLMAGRERTRDIGIMKALGFTDRTAFGLLLCESVLICAVGGALGIGIALATEQPLAVFLAAQFFPGYEITRAMLAGGIGAALAIGVLAGIVPAWRASRLRAVQALRSE